jgi:hypothetical protein
VRNIAIRVGLFAAIGVGALVFRPFLSGGAGDLKVGECFDVPTTATTVEDVQHHPCTEAHVGEVFFVGKLAAADKAPYPNDATLEAMVGAQCVPAFDKYTGLKFETDRTWTYGYFVPLSKDWATGDRGVICYAARMDEKPSTTSLKKS